MFPLFGTGQARRGVCTLPELPNAGDHPRPSSPGTVFDLDLDFEAKPNHYPRAPDQMSRIARKNVSRPFADFAARRSDNPVRPFRNRHSWWRPLDTLRG